MCRIFGFRSVIQSQVHNSLVRADNALMQQSAEHPDGWGVAYYVAHAPHVVKSEAKAMSDHLFRKVSGIVSSETVLAHIRKATLGSINILNTHPFQYGPWVFAHNGNIRNFDQLRPRLQKLVSPQLRRFVLGETDSELLFFIFLSYISARQPLEEASLPYNEVQEALAEALADIQDLTGPFCRDDQGPPTETYLTFLLTNGSLMIAHQGGKALYYSTYKKRCSDRDTCPYLSQECEAPTSSGKVNHLLISSESLSGENIWSQMQADEWIGVDQKMNLKT